MLVGNYGFVWLFFFARGVSFFLLRVAELNGITKTCGHSGALIGAWFKVHKTPAVYVIYSVSDKQA